VETAFLNPKLKEIYIEISDFFDLIYLGLNLSGKCLRLLKSLYGLKQALREWFLEVRKHLRTKGFKSLEADLNLFVSRGVFILLFVDDMLVIGKRQYVDVAKADIRSQ
jgi:hypothetical protein